jgi:malate dehydrogenase
MIALPRYCSVSGIPLPQLLGADRIDRLIEGVRAAGDLIVELAQRSSAYYAPSAAAAELVDSIHMDLKRVFSVSLMLAGEYGLKGVALSLPAVVGNRGIERVLTPELTDAQAEAFGSSADYVRHATTGGVG